MPFLMGKNSFFTKIFAQMWITIIGIKFGPFSLKHTLHAMVIFLSFGVHVLIGTCIMPFYMFVCILWSVHYLLLIAQCNH
jgi:hypothetical protein